MLPTYNFLRNYDQYCTNGADLMNKLSTTTCSKKDEFFFQPSLFIPQTSFQYSPTFFSLPQPTTNPMKTTINRAVTSPRRPRSEKKPIPDEQKDDKYFERRKRNNQAAKKSRDARRMREDQVALRASLLEHENAILRAQVLTLREEAQSLRQLLLNNKKLQESVDVIHQTEHSITKLIS